MWPSRESTMPVRHGSMETPVQSGKAKTITCLIVQTSRQLGGGLDFRGPRPASVPLHAHHVDGVVVLVGAVINIDQLERPITGRIHDACHVQDGVERRDAE